MISRNGLHNYDTAENIDHNELGKIARKPDRKETQIVKNKINRMFSDQKG